LIPDQLTDTEEPDMAHEIETHGTQAAAVFARKDAWHRLGTTVRDRAFTAEEAMRLGHLGGWNVRKVPLTATEVTEDGVNSIEAPGFATVRTNPFTGQPEALGVVGGGYTPLQNEDHAEFLNLLADQSGAIFDTAGSLRGGRQVFITMQLPDSLSVGGTDRVDLNIAALNSHDGSSAFRIVVTPVRVVCANTQSAALRNYESSFSIRHTRNAKAAVQAARDALGLTFTYVEAFEAEAERLIQTAMTDAAFDALVTDVFGAVGSNATKRVREAEQRRRRRLHWLFTDADTQAGIRDTAWAGYQAVAEYVDHFAPVRAKGEEAAARATRLLTSDDPDRLKRRAWTALAPA
jgi:phage/plasmid-like protein (TIGR03299 family)